jgi:putative ABC transport system substrate-binding protein
MASYIGRRELLAALGGAAVAWPLAAHAQQGERVRRIGVLMGWPESNPESQSQLASFVQELQKLGWVEGRNLRTDIRWWIAADPESTHRFAKELVALQPDLILSQTTPTTAALLQETRTIPIVFALADPVGSGFVASLARPGGNATGFVGMEGSLGGKWLELLKEIAPRVARVAALFNPETATYAEYYLKSFYAAAASFGVVAIAAPVHDMSELESVIATLALEPNGGLVVPPDPFTVAHSAEIISLADRYRLPAVYPVRFFAESAACCPMEMT